jgi:RNA polymerase sigma factor for flagellar operon FliA
MRQRLRASVVSLEEPVFSGEESDVYLGDTLEDLESDVMSDIERSELHDELVGAVESLPAQERTVIQRYYFQSEPLKQIKELLGVSESRVSQIHASAVRRLRKIMYETPA